MADDTHVSITWDARDPYPNFYHVEWAPAQSAYTDGLDNNTDRYVFSGNELSITSPGDGIYKFRIRMYHCESACRFNSWSPDFSTTLTPPFNPENLEPKSVPNGPLEVLKESVGETRYDQALAGSIARENGGTNTQTSSTKGTNQITLGDTQDGTITGNAGPENFNLYANPSQDNPASGHYATIPGVEYIWWMQFEIAFDGKFHNRKYHGCTYQLAGGELYKVLDQIGADDPSQGLIWPNTGVHLYYDGVKQTLLDNFIQVGRVGTDDLRHYFYLLWRRSPSDTSVLDSRKMSFIFDIDYHAGNPSYCRHKSAPQIHRDGRWIRVQNLSGARHRYQHVTEPDGTRRRSIGYFSVDPIYVAPHTTKTEWRRTYNGINQIQVTSTPANGFTYLAGETIDLEATYVVDVPASTVTIPLKIGNRTVELQSTSTAAGKEFTFEYTVLATDRDDDGISIDQHTISNSIPESQMTDWNPAFNPGHVHSVNRPPS